MEQRPPSVDALARTLSGLPHPLLVDVARTAIADGDPDRATELVAARRRQLLSPVINGTGVLLHTNLGRAPFAYSQESQARTVEFDLATGERGSRQAAVGSLFARLCETEAAIAVNNNAAAVLLVLAALARGRSVAVSRGESVEIGGSFRVPDVLAQSGARLVDVGTTNRTRLADYETALATHPDMALVLKVHPSNYTVHGFTESVDVASLAGLAVPVVVDLGSGLLDTRCPWLAGPPPAWLAGEPAAVQTLADGASVVTFSGDKLLGGPQAGIIAGRAEFVDVCARHPLARALRPGGLVLGALQHLALAYLERDGDAIPFWAMASTPVDALRGRAEGIAASVGGAVEAVSTEAVPGAGSAPGATIPSYGVSILGDRSATLRAHAPAVIARVERDATVVDLRAIDPGDDHHVVDALTAAVRR
jgi:L-seryl-tRNA(Ser) seleniumtransferase